MAGIHLRRDVKSKVSWRVYLRRKGIPSFSLIFSTREDAVKWCQNHEEKYYKDPDYYARWKQKLYREMRIKDIDEYEGLILPKNKAINISNINV